MAVLCLAGTDRARAEDAAQEAFARTYARWRRVRGGTNPAGYVYRVAFRLARKRDGLRASEAPDVADVADAAVAAVDVARAVAALPARQRVCVVLCRQLGFTAVEAAELLGIDAATVRTHLERAREPLRRALA